MSSETVSPHIALAVARDFHLAHERCRGSGHATDNGMRNPIVPSIVCLAFAIEVGLKSILLASGIPACGHRLDKLVDSMNDLDRARLVFLSGVESESFNRNLALVASAFVEWRYIYEVKGGKTISEQFLLMLWFAVEGLAVEKLRAYRDAG